LIVFSIHSYHYTPLKPPHISYLKERNGLFECLLIERVFIDHTYDVHVRTVKFD